MKIKVLITTTILITFSLILISCSAQENNPNLKALLKELPNEYPTSIDEIVNYPTGPLAEKSYRDDMEEMLDVVKTHLPRIVDDVDETYLRDWWQGYHSLFAEKYPDPTVIYEEKVVQPFSHPALQEEQPLYKENINVLIILDLSGSMNKQIEGKPMIQIAREAIQDFLSKLPSHANVGLRVYGHIGSGKDSDKERSCSRSDLIYDIQPYNKSEFKEALNKYEPKGWTPIAFSLEQAAEDFAEYPREEYTNLVYVVSDGIETCNGDPISAAKSLSDSEIHPIINVIGFGVDKKAQKQLEQIAEVGKGLYAKAGNEKELNKAFHDQEDMLRMWEEWKKQTKETLDEHKNNQIEEIEQFYEEWNKINDRERANIFFIINELRNMGYITDQAHRYFAEMRSERTERYNKLGHEWYTNLNKKVMRNYEDNNKKIFKELQP